MGPLSSSVVKTVIFSVAFFVLALGAQAQTIPNDPYFSYQTALTTSTQRAWDVTTDASSIVVAVIDTGMEMDHPDLVENLWTNSAEIPDNGLDDDGNGYSDDLHGYDFWDKDGDPDDLWGHGTLVSGIIGAVGDNHIGTTGVAWHVQLMILRVFGAYGERGKLSNFTEAIDYAIDNGAAIINLSWTMESSTTDGEIPLLKEKIERAREAGVLVVAAAGNNAVDLDETPVYPAAYSFDNLVSVAALSESEDALLGISNFGRGTVDVSTSGESILGPYLYGGYATLTGTSASAGLVSGVAALIRSERPDLGPADLRGILISSSQPVDSLESVIVSGGALDAAAGLDLAADYESGTFVETASEGGDVSGDDGPASPFGTSGGCSLIASD